MDGAQHGLRLTWHRSATSAGVSSRSSISARAPGCARSVVPAAARPRAVAPRAREPVAGAPRRRRVARLRAARRRRLARAPRRGGCAPRLGTTAGCESLELGPLRSRRRASFARAPRAPDGRRQLRLDRLATSDRRSSPRATSTASRISASTARPDASVADGRVLVTLAAPRRRARTGGCSRGRGSSRRSPPRA